MKIASRPRVRCERISRGRLAGLRQWRWRWAGVLLLLVLLPQMPWFGCTPQRRYEVLSLFFDGVPDPNAPALTERDAEGNPVVLAASFSHKPYEEGKCEVCHGSATGSYSDFTKLDDSICLQCHAGVPESYPRMHGPVALGQCSLCHLPHESSVRPLLLDEPAALCTTCHLRDLLPPAPADHLTDRSCLDCHMGHGGTQRGLLREGWSATTRPALPARSAPPPTATPPRTTPPAATPPATTPPATPEGAR